MAWVDRVPRPVAWADERVHLWCESHDEKKANIAEQITGADAGGPWRLANSEVVGRPRRSVRSFARIGNLRRAVFSGMVPQCQLR